MTQLYKILMFAILQLPFSALAAFYDGPLRYEITSENTVSVVGYNVEKLSLSIDIPNSLTINGKTYYVTSIGEKAFYQTHLTYVTIGQCVNSIGERAFGWCTWLTHVEIPNSVTSIGYYAFEGCSALRNVTIPNSVTEIRDHAFAGCTGLTSVTIGNSITSIWEGAFDGCTGLTSVHISELAKWCSIGFGNEKANPLYYAKRLYLNDSEIKDLTIPNSVTSIGNMAFYGCTGLTSVTVPNSVTSIGVSAFKGCTGLTSVTIPNSVTSIGQGAFNDTGIYNNHPDGIFYVDKWVCGYKGDTPSGNQQLRTDTRGICNSAFSYCTGLTSITIGNSVTSIGNSAFAYCRGLTSVIIPNSVTEIGEWAFSGCSGLTSVTIPGSVTSIGDYAFSYCSGLTSVFIPNSVTSIGHYAFEGCSGLTSVTIPGSVTSIGYGAFRGCSGLTRIDAYPNPAKVSMGSNVFEYVPKVGTLHVLPKYLSAYQTADQWKDFANIVADLTEIEPIIGDVNADGEISIADVTSLVDVVLRQESTGASDVNGDGETSVADITALTDLLLSRP